MKFGLEVLKAVRAEVGEDFCVGMRICGDEFHRTACPTRT